MASDSLEQVGKNLGQTRKETQLQSRRFAQNLPVIEKSTDIVGTLYTFRMDFYTYTDSPVVYLDIIFFPRFRTLDWMSVNNG